jgi:hypothetical protein
MIIRLKMYKESGVPHHFQLSYSVEKRKETEASRSAVIQARRLLREIEGWETIKHIETTLVGKINLESDTPNSKRREALELVRGAILDILKNEKIDNDVSFYGCLMVDKLGEYINIEINPKD